MKYQEGDYVFVEPSAEIDCNLIAWTYIKTVMQGVIRGETLVSAEGTPASEIAYCVDFGAPFAGGIDCQGRCAKGQGQWITAKHLDLDFERSRTVVTVPNVEGYEDEDERETNP